MTESKKPRISQEMRDGLIRAAIGAPFAFGAAFTTGVVHWVLLGICFLIFGWIALIML
jgi:hypothetical protein